MPDNDTRRGGLRRRIAERWTPLFDDDEAITAITAEEFADACNWPALLTAGVVTADETPLALAGLRLSAIFPRHLLRYRDDGRLVPIAFDDAVALVRLTLAQGGRDMDTVATAAAIPHGAAHPTDIGETATDDTADETADDTAEGDATVDGSGGGLDDKSSRRRFFRSRD